MQRDDLPLFAWQPPVKILLFPMTSRIGKVRHTAQHLVSKQGGDADLYWKQVVSAARRHLLRVGLSDKEVDAEIRRFHEAVQAEIVRMTYGNQTSGGAA